MAYRRMVLIKIGVEVAGVIQRTCSLQDQSCQHLYAESSVVLRHKREAEGWTVQAVEHVPSVDIKKYFNFNHTDPCTISSVLKLQASN